MMITPNKKVAPPTLLRSRVPDEAAPAAPLLFAETTTQASEPTRQQPQRPTVVRPVFDGDVSAFTPLLATEPTIEPLPVDSPGATELSVFVSPLSSTSRHLALGQRGVPAEGGVVRVPCELPAMSGQPLPSGHFAHIDPATPTRVLRPHCVAEASADWRPVRIVAKRH
jgi:hypothetical protein